MTRRSMLRRSTKVLLLLAFAHAVAGPASAECMFIPPFPKAEPAIRSADEVIIGDVIQAGASDLDLGVLPRRVVDGQAADRRLP